MNARLLQKAIRITLCTAFGRTGPRQLQRFSSNVALRRISSLVLVTVVVAAPPRHLLPRRSGGRFTGRPRLLLVVSSFIVLARRDVFFLECWHRPFHSLMQCNHIFFF